MNLVVQAFQPARFLSLAAGIGGTGILSFGGTDIAVCRCAARVEGHSCPSRGRTCRGGVPKTRAGSGGQECPPLAVPMTDKNVCPTTDKNVGATNAPSGTLVQTGKPAPQFIF